MDHTVRPGGDSSPTLPGDFEPSVVWKGNRLRVTAFGSSSCPPVASAARVVSAHSIAIRFEPVAGVPCTDDYGAQVSRIAAPVGAEDLSRRVVATLELVGAPAERVRVTFAAPSASER